MNETASRARTPIIYGFACVLGAAYVVALGLSGAVDALPFRVIFAFSFLGMSAMTYLLASRAVLIWPIGLFVFTGICAAVITSVSYDSMLGRPERNLFPFEIAIYSAFAMPGVIAGLALRWSVQRDQSRERRNSN